MCTTVRVVVEEEEEESEVVHQGVVDGSSVEVGLF
jgi:hypothetical protein